MIVDARGLDDGTAIDADICVVGAGAAGIALARALTGSGARVVLVESGGTEPDDEVQRLARGRSVGHPYFPLDATRARVLGGSTSKWAGWCRPLDPIDLDVRPGMDLSGWPLRWDALLPYYEQAHDVLELGPFDYDASRWERATGTAALSLSGGVGATIYRFSPPTRMGERYRRDLEQAADVTVYLHANLVAIRGTSDRSAVRRIEVATLNRRRLEVRARDYVLATGGIENARLLLAAAPDELVNTHGLVGRCFMEHPHLDLGYILLAADESELAFYRENEVSGARARGALTLTEDRVREAQALGMALTLHPEASRAPGEVADRVPLAQDVPALLDAIEGPRRRRMVRLYLRAEQAPNPDSRVSLAADRDAFGLRRAELDWRITEQDLHRLRSGVETVAAAIGAAGLGRAHLRLSSDDLPRERIIGGHHHLGTTRMSPDIDSGVVNADLRMHGVDNLYIAGSSVFPTGGYANPTLTIVALALRLADHLRTRR